MLKSKIASGFALLVLTGCGNGTGYYAYNENVTVSKKNSDSLECVVAATQLVPVKSSFRPCRLTRPQLTLNATGLATPRIATRRVAIPMVVEFRAMTPTPVFAWNTQTSA